MPLCFAYGSNLDLAAMAQRCPASRALGVARLPAHYVLIMREGYLSVERDPRRTAWGLLWDVALADMPALDRYEAVSEGLYRKQQRSVLTPTGARRALVYVGCNTGPGRARPGYMEAVLAAARCVPLPDAYLRELETLLPRRGTPAGLASSGEPLPSARPSHGVTPTRSSPFDKKPDPSAGWTWTP